MLRKRVSTVHAFAIIVVIASLLSDAERVHAFPVATAQQLSMALHRLNLDAEAFTAAGVSSALIAGAVNDAQAHITANPTALSSVDIVYSQARAEHDRLQRIVQSGVYAPEDLTAYTTSVSQLATVTAQRQATLDNLWTAATADLSENQRLILTKIRGNSVWEAPIEFQTVDRTEVQWVALREALANERISAANNETPDAEAQALLAQLRAEPTVASAIANLAANLSANTVAWNQAINS